jgi:cell wall-associated NlpC family hydrolase
VPAVALSIAVAGTSACAPSSRVGPGAVAVASAQSGKPYRYGATGPSSFDCSGLVQYVYRRVGRQLPRTAAAQYYAARHVARGSERPGDLVFFGAPFGVYHVGIYTGGGQMIDAPHTGAVVTKRRIWSARVAFGRVY